MCTDSIEPGKPRAKGKGIYTLTGPCSNCPFRTDQTFLDAERAREIAESLQGGATFYCHKTLDYDEAFDDDSNGSPAIAKKSRACAGSLIVMEKEQRPNQIMRIGERLGLYDRTRLEMDAPVSGSLAEWVAAHRQDEPGLEYCGVVFDNGCANPPGRSEGFRAGLSLEAPACDQECPGCGEMVCDACLEVVPEVETGRDVYCKGCRKATADEVSHHWTATPE